MCAGRSYRTPVAAAVAPQNSTSAIGRRRSPPALAPACPAPAPPKAQSDCHCPQVPPRQSPPQAMPIALSHWLAAPPCWLLSPPPNPFPFDQYAPPHLAPSHLAATALPQQCATPLNQPLVPPRPASASVPAPAAAPGLPPERQVLLSFKSHHQQADGID